MNIRSIEFFDLLKEADLLKNAGYFVGKPEVARLNFGCKRIFAAGFSCCIKKLV